MATGLRLGLTLLDELIQHFECNNDKKEKIVFVAMEFVSDTVFSGNGVYARTIVSSLIKSNSFEILVICASNKIKESILTVDDEFKSCQLLIIPVNEWKSLNWKCDYKLFGDNFTASINIFDKFNSYYDGEIS